MVAVGDTPTCSRDVPESWVSLWIVAPGKAPSGVGLNVGGSSTDFSTGSRKLEDSHNVNTRLGFCVGLSPACLRE